MKVVRKKARWRVWVRGNVNKMQLHTISVCDSEKTIEQFMETDWNNTIRWVLCCHFLPRLNRVLSEHVLNPMTQIENSYDHREIRIDSIVWNVARFSAISLHFLQSILFISIHAKRTSWIGIFLSRDPKTTFCYCCLSSIGVVSSKWPK